MRVYKVVYTIPINNMPNPPKEYREVIKHVKADSFMDALGKLEKLRPKCDNRLLNSIEFICWIDKETYNDSNS